MIFSWASQKVSLSLDILLAGGGRGNSSTLSIFSSTISRRLFWVTLDCVTNANIGEVCSWGGSDTDDASVGPVLTGGDVDKEEIKETWKMLQLRNYCLDVHWDVHSNCECTDIFHSMLQNLHVMIRLTSNQKTFQWLNLLQLSSQDILAK